MVFRQGRRPCTSATCPPLCVGLRAPSLGRGTAQGQQIATVLFLGSDLGRRHRCRPGRPPEPHVDRGAKCDSPRGSRGAACDKDMPRGQHSAGPDPPPLASNFGLRAAGTKKSFGETSPGVCPEEHLFSRMHSNDPCGSVALLNPACHGPLCTPTRTLQVPKSRKKTPRNHAGDSVDFTCISPDYSSMRNVSLSLLMWQNADTCSEAFPLLIGRLVALG